MGQQGSSCRSFSECNHARVITSEIMHVISSQVIHFSFSPRFGVLKVNFHWSISSNQSHFCNLFFVMDNFYSFGFDHIFLFDLFENYNWLKNQQSTEKLKVFSNFRFIHKLASMRMLKLKNWWSIAWNAWMEISIK